MKYWYNSRWHISYELTTDFRGTLFDLDENEVTTFNSLNQLRMLMDDEVSYQAFITQG